MVSVSKPSLSPHLRRLEAEAIGILRETLASFRNPVLLYSIGKDSSVVLHLALKAFAPGRLPFPCLLCSSFVLIIFLPSAGQQRRAAAAAPHHGPRDPQGRPLPQAALWPHAVGGRLGRRDHAAQRAHIFNLGPRFPCFLLSHALPSMSTIADRIPGADVVRVHVFCHPRPQGC